jgi:CYTH domain-containing protein
VKKGKGVKKAEIQTTLSQEQFEEMWPAIAYFLEKVRFKIPLGKHTIDFDMYKGNRFEGLMTAEVEFESVEEAEEFIPPDWFGEEKTDDSRYSNANLAKHGLPKED